MEKRFETKEWLNHSSTESGQAHRVELKHRMHLAVKAQHIWLSAVLRGHYQYFGVMFNSQSLTAFYKCVKLAWFNTLRKRSQKGNMTWERRSGRLGPRPVGLSESQGPSRQFQARWAPVQKGKQKQSRGIAWGSHSLPLPRFTLRLASERASLCRAAASIRLTRPQRRWLLSLLDCEQDVAVGKGRHCLDPIPNAKSSRQILSLLIFYRPGIAGVRRFQCKLFDELRGYDVQERLYYVGVGHFCSSTLILTVPLTVPLTVLP
jgi:hypothetical protein